MWFDGWQGIARMVVTGLSAYVALIALLRISGKRTLSKLNAFDLVVTVALGSTFATVLLSSDVALAEGVAAFAVLIFGQYAVATLSVRFWAVSRAVKSEPRVLLYRGRLLNDAMRQERVTADEIESVVRGAGLGSLEQAGAVVLETDGTFHVLPKGQADGSAMPGGGALAQDDTARGRQQDCGR
ncbi:MAG: YetF domain-containing protein [Polaromonas sp.]